jgi:hypothetical protein
MCFKFTGSMAGGERRYAARFVGTSWRALWHRCRVAYVPGIPFEAVFGIQAQVLVDGSGLPFVVAAGIAGAPG